MSLKALLKSSFKTKDKPIELADKILFPKGKVPVLDKPKKPHVQIEKITKINGVILNKKLNFFSKTKTIKGNRKIINTIVDLEKYKINNIIDKIIVLNLDSEIKLRYRSGKNIANKQSA